LLIERKAPRKSGKFTEAVTDWCRQDADSGIYYKIEEAQGTQKVCNPSGYLIKPFDPRITGKFNYDARIRRIKQTGADLSEIELPKTLQSNYKRNYLP
jgi:hypothetical protein